MENTEYQYDTYAYLRIMSRQVNQFMHWINIWHVESF